MGTRIIKPGKYQILMFCSDEYQLYLSYQIYDWKNTTDLYGDLYCKGNGAIQKPHLQTTNIPALLKHIFLKVSKSLESYS